MRLRVLYIIKVGVWISEFPFRCPDFEPQILPRVPNPLPRFCIPDFAPRWVSGFTSPKSVTRILPPGFCRPWVSGFPSPKSAARILPPDFPRVSESRVIHDPALASASKSSSRHNCRRQRLCRTIDIITIVVAIIIVVVLIIIIILIIINQRPPNGS